MNPSGCAGGLFMLQHHTDYYIKQRKSLMEKARIILSMNKDWSFHLGDIALPECKTHSEIYDSSKSGSARGIPQGSFDARSWETVNLPHDWAIALPFDENGCADWGYKPRGKAWYRKCFNLPEEYRGKQLTLDFEGIATHATVYFNGSVIKRSFSGYVPFTVDITDRALFGAAPNVLAIFVDADAWEGWWYEGAGIYRDIKLTVKSAVNIAKYGVYVKTEQSYGDAWSVSIETTVNSTEYRSSDFRLVTEIYNESGCFVGDCVTYKASIPALSQTVINHMIKTEFPTLWELDNPVLYTAVTLLFVNGILADNTETKFGFRTISIDAKKGFFLNGKNIKLLGTCNHQDHAGIGTAVPESVYEYRVKKLKEMGCNAYRTAHGMPDTALLNVCDRLGMLVMDENRTFETSDEGLSQLHTMVLRDRNHPSVIMYSIFNEEPLQVKSEGKRMKNEIKKLDPTRIITGAMHGGILEDSGVGAILDVCGVNYQINSYEAFHEKYPDVPLIGSETTSSFSVRGCYETNAEKHEIASYDDDYAAWGNSVRDTWKNVKTHPYISGAFMWTGFDYLGEPTPHVWPSVSSFFGMMDTCGFEKDAYYLSKAIFSNEPYCRMIPSHWSFSGGTVRVMSCTNCEESELFLNGKSLGRKTADLFVQANWNVEYEAGTLEIVGYNDGKRAASYSIVTAGKPAALQLIPHNEQVTDCLEDAVIIDVFAVDKDGVQCPDADLSVTFKAEGGKIIGTANGNPNCHEEFTSPNRTLFHGKCQLIARADSGVRQLKITAVCGRIKAQPLCVRVIHRSDVRYIESTCEQFLTDWKASSKLYEIRPDPNEQTDEFDMNTWEPINIENAPNKLYNKEGHYALYRTSADIPTKINGHLPVLHFHKLWGCCEIYVNKKLAGSCELEWPTAFDCALTPEMCGKCGITVLVKGNGNGGGVCAAAVLR